MNATIRIPATNAQIQARPYPSHGFGVLASVRLDLLAEALGSMEHDDTEPGVRLMNPDQCRDALLREILLGWSPAELVEAKIPGAVEMAQDLEDLRDEVRNLRAELSSVEHLRTNERALLCEEIAARQRAEGTLSRVEAERDGLRIGSCVWQPAEDGCDEREWSTTCGHEHQFIHGPPSDNSAKFCPYCGGIIEIDAPTPTEGEKP